MKISVVIPVYGCKAALTELHRRLCESLAKIADDYEILLVNDNCPQNSWEVIEDICAGDPRVKGIELSRNFGQMKAILAGLDKSEGDWVVVMDCDLQDRPEEIPRLYEKAMEGYDIVFARRANRKDNKLKVLLSQAFYKVYEYATDGSYDGALCNFSIAKQDVIESYCSMREYHRGYVMYMNWLGYRQAVIDVEHDNRFEGRSSYSFRKRVNIAIELLTSQSDRLLRLFAKIGLLISLVSFLVIIGLVIYKLVADVSIGWTSMIATTVLMGGMIIMVIGIVGMYVGNIFMQTKNRPLYIIRQTINDKDNDRT